MRWATLHYPLIHSLPPLFGVYIDVCQVALRESYEASNPSAAADLCVSSSGTFVCIRDAPGSRLFGVLHVLLVCHHCVSSFSWCCKEGRSTQIQIGASSWRPMATSGELAWLPSSTRAGRLPPHHSTICDTRGRRRRHQHRR